LLEAKKLSELAKQRRQTSSIKRLVDSEELTRLRDFRPPFSPLYALGVQHNERNHSEALRFFLDPNEQHGWGFEFLKRFAREVGSDLKGKIETGKVSSIEVSTEWCSLDVLIESDCGGPVIGIEVKLWAPEGKGQIERYQKTIRKAFSKRDCLMVFLTLDGREPKTASEVRSVKCVSLSWLRVSQLLGEVALERENMPEDVKKFIDDFRSYIMAITEGDPNERRIVSDLFHDPALGQAVLKAARIRYCLFTKDVVHQLIDRIEERLKVSGFEISNDPSGGKNKEYFLTYNKLAPGDPSFVFLFYDFPDDPRFGSGMHVLINGNEGGFDERAYRFAFNASGEGRNLLEAPPGWGGNWRLALPAEFYPAGTSKGWKFETDSFDDQWLDNAVKCFEEALKKIPKSLFPPSLNHA
jgi:hypothetical protein